jgi:subtilisin family serine protease
LAAPGTGRLPWSDYQKLLRFQVMAPGVTVPEQEYMFHTAGPLTQEQAQELEELGLTLVAAVGDTVVVRGSLTSFEGLGPEGTVLPWVQSVTAQIELSVSGNPTFYWVPMEDVLKETGADQLHALGFRGQGIKIGVIDSGFTGDLGQELGAQHVHYIQVEYLGSLRTPHITDGFIEGKHGEACSQAIANIAPAATFYLMSATNYTDRKALLEFIKEGKIDIDVLSDSTYYSVPGDHNDGRGELALLGDEVVASGVPYFYALGNFAVGERTDRSFYEGEFTDSDDNNAHDFTPGSSSTLDRNTMAINVHPWEGDDPVYLSVFLEWNGWPNDVQQNPGSWSQSALIDVQDIDIYLSYMNPQGQVIELPDVKGNRNQFEALDGSRNVYVTPQEGMGLQLDRPGTYLVTVKNNTLAHIPYFRDRGIDTSLLFERAVDMHMYVYTAGSLKTAAPSFTLEHHTVEGSIINMGGAHNVIGVGAVGWTGTSWCVTPYSSRGPTSDGRLKPELVAPTLYETPVFDGEPPYFSGTSASAPVAAGVAALLLQADPTLTPEELRQVLSEGTTRICGGYNGACSSGHPVPALCNNAWNYIVGYGLVNSFTAYQLLKK